jgi:hypothetical protein
LRVGFTIAIVTAITVGPQRRWQRSLARMAMLSLHADAMIRPVDQVAL